MVDPAELESAMEPPYRVETYCGTCHDTKPHYLKAAHCDDRRDCYECVGCLHLVFAPKLKPTPNWGL